MPPGKNPTFPGFYSRPEGRDIVYVSAIKQGVVMLAGQYGSLIGASLSMIAFVRHYRSIEQWPKITEQNR